MLHAYALEPALLSNWANFRYFVEKFGVHQGRLISRYPKRWKAMVRDSLAACSDIERLRIVEKLNLIDDRMQSRYHEWSDAQDWLVNAETEHAKRPFHAVVAGANPRARDFVLIADALGEHDPRWAIERERVIERSAEAISRAAAPVIALGRRVVFIDPHFSPFNVRSRNTFKAFLQIVANRPASDGVVESIEFHTQHNPAMATFVAECQTRLPSTVKGGMKVTIVRWIERAGGEGLHNRYILTERGGVRLAWGLDEGAPSQTDDISLLERTVFEQRWAQYCGIAPAFDLHEKIYIVGTL